MVSLDTKRSHVPHGQLLVAVQVVVPFQDMVMFATPRTLWQSCVAVAPPPLLVLSGRPPLLVQVLLLPAPPPLLLVLSGRPPLLVQVLVSRMMVLVLVLVPRMLVLVLVPRMLVLVLVPVRRLLLVAVLVLVRVPHLVAVRVLHLLLLVRAVVVRASSPSRYGTRLWFASGGRRRGGSGQLMHLTPLGQRPRTLRRMPMSRRWSQSCLGSSSSSSSSNSSLHHRLPTARGSLPSISGTHLCPPPTSRTPRPLPMALAGPAWRCGWKPDASNVW